MFKALVLLLPFAFHSVLALGKKSKGKKQVDSTRKLAKGQQLGSTIVGAAGAGTFSDGTACPLDAVLCTEGRYSGTLSGYYKYIATAFDPIPNSVALTAIGTVILTPDRFCNGFLVMKDQGTTVPDDLYATVSYIDKDESTGDCKDFESLSVVTSGQFLDDGTCIGCGYEGYYINI